MYRGENSGEGRVERRRGFRGEGTLVGVGSGQRLEGESFAARGDICGRRGGGRGRGGITVLCVR